MSKRSRKRPAKKRSSGSPSQASSRQLSASRRRLWPPRRPSKTIVAAAVAVAVTVTGGLLYSLYENKVAPDGRSDIATHSNVARDTTSKVTVETSVRLPTVPGLDQHRFDAVVRGVAQREDPVLDGWDSEHFHDLADKQLHVVGTMMSQPDQRNAAEAAKVADAAFASSGIRPPNLRETFSDKSLTGVARRHYGNRSPGIPRPSWICRAAKRSKSSRFADCPTSASNTRSSASISWAITPTRRPISRSVAATNNKRRRSTRRGSVAG